MDEDKELDKEGFSEEVVLELEVQEGVTGQILRVLAQNLGVVFVYMEEWFGMKLGEDVLNGRNDSSKVRI